MIGYPKPEKRITREEALKMADDEFSLLMRAYHSSEGMVWCCTCGLMMDWRGTGVAQWGHYKPRTYMWTRWDSNNGGIQCEGCNCYGSGMEKQMRKYLVSTHGDVEVERIESEYKRELLIGVQEILELADKFREKKLEIIKEKNL